jgi:signal peptidase I
MMIAGYDVQYSSGSSMEPTLYDGSVVIYEEGNSPEVGDIAVYEDEDGSNLVHRVVENRNEGPVLKGDSNHRPDARVEWSSDCQRDITAPSDQVHEVVFVLYDGSGGVLP